MSGKSTSGLDLAGLQDAVRQAILDHEPRILPASLTVEVVVSNAQLDHHNLIGFRIGGQLWAQPVPLELLVVLEGTGGWPGGEQTPPRHPSSSSAVQAGPTRRMEETRVTRQMRDRSMCRE